MGLSRVHDRCTAKTDHGTGATFHHGGTSTDGPLMKIISLAYRSDSAILKTVDASGTVLEIMLSNQISDV